MASRIIIGVGNSDRGDDAAGLEAAHLLQGLVPADVRVISYSGEITALIEQWEGATHLILIDAALSGSDPGSVRCLDVSHESRPLQFSGRFSSHGIGIAEVIEMARVLNRLPPNVRIFGIEAKNFAMGAPLSPQVQGAVHQVVEEILKLLR
jgi:hydrogenase maturation protease